MKDKIIKLQCIIPNGVELTDEAMQKLTKLQIDLFKVLPEGIEIEYIAEKK